MMLLDGKKLAGRILGELKAEVSDMKKKLRLGVVVAGNDPVIAKFISEKKRIGESIGVDVRVYPFEETITTNELRSRIAEIVHEKKNTGIIIQLPLPPHVQRQYILNSVVPEKDVDVLSSRSLGSFVAGTHPIMPPVAGSVKALFEEYGIEHGKKNVVLLGAGILVGRPIALWLLGEGAPFTVLTENSADTKTPLSSADIVVSGIGKPGFVTGAMVKKGVIAIDAGTSESEGKLVGDIDFDSVSKKAEYITPVPGGVGPLTVAMLFKNLAALAKRG